MYEKSKRGLSLVAAVTSTLALSVGSLAHAAPADDAAAMLQTYYQQAGGAKTLNDVYATYQWAQPFVPTTQNPDGTLNWASAPINDVTAQDVLAKTFKIAASRCGSDRAQTTNDEVMKFSKVLGAKFNADQYKQQKANFCQLVQVVAQMKTRYEAYQYFKQNGIKLAGKSKSEKLGFKNRTRHVGVGFTLMYYPDLMDTAQNGLSVEDRFQYNSYIKWSDDNPTNLNIVKRIRESQGNNEDMLCLPVISNWGFLCVRINDVKTSSINMSVWAKVRRYDRSKTVSLGSFDVPAPFGYLDELSQMKDKAKQDMYNKVTTQLTNYLNVNTQMIQTLETAYAYANK